MIIWINGAFGAGKTSVADILVQQIDNAVIFDPEGIGYVIQKTFPDAREMDYQDLPMWRRLVIQFIADAKDQFPSPLIIPMTLVVPDYIDEIFSSLTTSELNFHHFFLEADKEELQRRITNQVIVETDQERDEEVRQWRLAQIDRCCKASAHMPEGTIFLDTNSNSPDQLVQLILAHISSG